MMLEDAMNFLNKADPVSLMIWLRNAAETISVQTEPNNHYWWRISQIFEEAAYKIKELKVQT